MRKSVDACVYFIENDKYQPEIKAQKDEIGELYDNAEVYFKEHASDLCKPGTKQGETKLAFFGVKIGMPTVIKTIRDSLRSVAARWFADEAMTRFAADAGDYLQAVEIGIMETKRRANVVKVLCCQIMQLKGGTDQKSPLKPRARRGFSSPAASPAKFQFPIST